MAIDSNLHLIWKRDKEGVHRADYVGFRGFITKSDFHRPGHFWVFQVIEDGSGCLECEGITQSLKKAKFVVEYYMYHNQRLPKRAKRFYPPKKARK